ncbi:MAG: diguanylate cyclase [Rhodoferax sp.]|uniref:bifunctional diguanylate cyclase/phosphodiesterase n=1 Tax=Rhodoferax sp. TaxID=50421 RepID=UPI0014011A7B|nr:diguanylate cyclase [Rhodoferax sp.]NDP40116.1 diguanylate cyclase [Rhodoferax sp.]
MKPLLSRGRRWGLLALALGLVGASLAFNLAREHEQTAAAELERLTTQSKVIEDNLTRQLTAINLSLESLRVELPGWRDGPDGPVAGVQHMKSLEAAMPSVRTFMAIDVNGVVTLSNREALIGLNASQRDYFQAPLQSLNPNILFVSPPFKTVLNKYVINLSRVVLDRQGQFAGVVSAAVDPVDIQTLLNSVRYADDMRSMLVHGDGTVFISQPTLVDVIGKNISVPGSFFRQHLESKRPVSHFEGISPATGDKRLPVLRTVQPAELAMDKPLVVSLSRDPDAVFAHWQRDVRNQSVAYLLLVLLSALGLIIYQRWQVRQGRFEERLRLATQASGVGIWEYDLASKRYDWDAAMFELFGLNPEKANALNNDWLQTLLPGEAQRMKDATRATIKQGQVFDMTFQIRRADGQLRFMRNRAALHCDQQGAPCRLVGATEDVTERKQREADLRIAAAAFDCQESIVVTDPDKVILRVNRAFSGLFGYTAEEALGQTPRLFKSGRHEQSFYAAMWECIKRDGAWQGEVWNRKKSGEIFPDLLSITAVHNDQQEVTHYVGTHVDLTERKAAQAAIEKLAFYDALTGLPNRRLLDDRLHQALSNARRNKTHLALLFIDLDKFKPVNDDFGHAVGDELLLAVAQRLQTCVRESDAVARVGGDEFVVLLSAIEAAPDASAVARKIHDALIAPFVLSQGQSVTISSSTGIAIYPEHGSNDAELTQHADAAMYQAKAAGRDRFEVYTPAADSASSQPRAEGGGADSPIENP